MDESLKTNSPLRGTIGGFAPKMVELTEGTLFGDIWERPGLGHRDRSLVTITALATAGHWDQLASHVAIGRDNGLTQEEVVEAFTHLAFYCGWPTALTAIKVAQRVLEC